MNITDTLYQMIEHGRKGRNKGFQTGIPKMDEYTGGLQKAMYYLIFGLSGSGKTSYVLYSNIYRPLKDNPDADIKIVYYSLEMSAEILLAKILCLYIYEEYNVIIPYTKLLSWQEILDDESYEYIKKGRAWIEKIQDRFIIFDTALSAKSYYATFMPLLEKWGTFQKSEDGRRTIYIKNNPDQLVVSIIDHLGLCRPDPGRTKKQEIDEISALSVGFRERCKVSSINLMQENRNSSDMDRRKADMSESSAEDIKDSSNPNNDQEYYSKPCVNNIIFFI